MPTRRTPVVVYLLILANVLAYIGLDARFTYSFGLVPARLIAHPESQWLTLFTSMFLHDPQSYLHLAGNMLFLWIFGDNVEDALGSLRFLAFYILCGLAAAAAQILVDPHSPLPMIGASGAISGVLAAYGSLYPRAPITVLNPVPLLWLFWGLFFDLPAWFVILEYFVANLLNAVLSVNHRSGGVAFFAHIGGFLAGLFLVRLFMMGRERTDYDRWTRFLDDGDRVRVRRARRRDPWT